MWIKRSDKTLDKWKSLKVKLQRRSEIRLPLTKATKEQKSIMISSTPYGVIKDKNDQD